MTRSLLPSALVLLLSLFAGGCAKKKPASLPGDDSPRPGAAVTSEAPDVREGLPSPDDADLVARVSFAFDSATLDEDARRMLREAAPRLTDSFVRVEGHADDRGSTQYNLALSERRANAVVRYLRDLGVPASRLTTAGYGEEKPLVPGHDEAAWSRNRRAEVLLAGKAGRVAGGR